jgi:hypothetical protein
MQIMHGFERGRELESNPTRTNTEQGRVTKNQTYTHIYTYYPLLSVT